MRMSINGTPVLIFSLCGGRQPGSRVLRNSTGYLAPSELLSALSTDSRVITTPGARIDYSVLVVLVDGFV